MNTMKFDLYKGTEKEMSESGGVSIGKYYSRLDIVRHCNKRGIDSSALFEGDWVAYEGDNIGIWIEEAINVCKQAARNGKKKRGEFFNWKTVKIDFFETSLAPGKKFIAVAVPDYNCTGCFFFESGVKCKLENPCCTSSKRKDKKDVIYKEAKIDIIG